MKTKIATLILVGSLILALAYQMIESVQQALKDQGFYYGEVTGEKNANLTAAIRRYQIRNGLQVNGDMNNETIQSLGTNSSASSQPPAKSASPGPLAPKSAEKSPIETANVTPEPIQPFTNAPQAQQAY